MQMEGHYGREFGTGPKNVPTTMSSGPGNLLFKTDIGEFGRRCYDNASLTQSEYGKLFPNRSEQSRGKFKTVNNLGGMQLTLKRCTAVTPLDGKSTPQPDDLAIDYKGIHTFSNHGVTNSLIMSVGQQWKKTTKIQKRLRFYTLIAIVAL